MGKYRLRGQVIAVSTFCICTAVGAQNRDHSGLKPPRLAVVIVVDQMRSDYLDRFSSKFTGGLARLVRDGAVYTHVYHHHSATETAVGHATISTGCYPSHHGIVGNGWYDQELQKIQTAVGDTSFPLVGTASKGGASPHNLLMPALGDWLKEKSPRSKVYSVALKDRSAILMGGRHPDGAFWYDRNTGNYVTSRYYSDTLPTVVQEFNRVRLVDSLRVGGWQRLYPESEYALSHADSFPAENDGVHVTFPYLFDSLTSPKDIYTMFYGTPFADQATLHLAMNIVAQSNLGKDGSPDLLWISCSAADAIGHAFGPNSQEMEDYYLRLDRYLDTFLTVLDSVVGPANYATVLTADHGTMIMPEDMTTHGLHSERIGLDSVIARTMQAGDSAAIELHLSKNPIVRCDYEILLNYEESGTKGIADSTVQNAVARHVLRLQFIEAAFPATQVMNSQITGDELSDLVRNIYHPARRPDIYLVYSENHLVENDPHGTTHGSPFEYDRHVPLIFSGTGIPPFVHSAEVHSVDIAPTVAALLSVPLPNGIDGRRLQLKGSE